MAEELLPATDFLPAHIDTANLFWVTPEQVGEVNELITSARLSTMALGVSTRQGEFGVERDALKDALKVAEAPFEAQRARAIDIGFMYGTLLTGEDPTTESSLPSAYKLLLENIMIGIDGNDPNDANRLFMRLRDVEVALTGSDVLAFCLAASQDHLSNQFRSTEHEDGPLSHEELTWQQSLFYAGALTAALICSDNSLHPLPRLEITGSMARGENPVNVVLELEHDDDLRDAVEHQLSNRYHFFIGYIGEKGKKTRIGVTANNVQFGPNQISIANFSPILVTPDIQLDTKRLDRIVIGKKLEDGTTQLSVRGDVSDAVQEIDASDIVAVEHAGMYISKYGENHPFNTVIQNVLAHGSEKVAQSLTYTTAESLKMLEFRLPSKRAMRFMLAGGLISTWSPEVEDVLMGNGLHPNWAQGVIASLVWVGLYKGITVAQKKLAQSRSEDMHIHLGASVPYINQVVRQ